MKLKKQLPSAMRRLELGGDGDHKPRFSLRQPPAAAKRGSEWLQTATPRISKADCHVPCPMVWLQAHSQGACMWWVLALP